MLVLGVTQDGGYPHIGCEKTCCEQAGNKPKTYVTSLALVDPKLKKWWLFEASPDLPDQLKLFQTLTSGEFNYLPAGIFLTHAHMGHYTGLMYLGREALGSKNVIVYVLPRMKEYLSANGPWSQLVNLKNIELNEIQFDNITSLSPNVSVTPFLVPHRDEFSETAGFKIVTSSKKYLFIPDIDKWDKWDKKLIEEVKQVDVAFLDATFYSTDELPGRDIKEIPHPLVPETMELVNDPIQQTKINFIHFNHSNPLLWDDSKRADFQKSTFKISIQGTRY